MPNLFTTDPDDDNSRERPTTPSASGTAPFFPDLPSELLPKSLDGSGFDAAETRQAKEAIELLTRKMAAITSEYIEGHVNQAQFQAIYTRHGEQRAIIERILEKDPESKTWQAVTESGSTSLLRRRFAARPTGMLLIEIRTGETLRMLGMFDLKADLLVPILSTVIERSVLPFEAGSKSTLLEGGRWLMFIPGEMSAGIVIFSQEPSGQQIKTLVTLHRDFERANHAALQAGAPDPERLVYPQEALF